MIFAKINNDTIEIRFKTYIEPNVFKDYVDKIKSITGRRFHADGNDSYWTIPLDQQEKLKNMFKKIEWEEVVPDVVLPAKKISTDLTYMDELLHPPYPFQIVGINFLCDIGKCVLADEMGLGKTIQILGAAYKLYRQGKAKKTLIICPSSLKYEWENQIKFFFDVENRQVSYIIIDGPPKHRQMLYKDIINKEDILFTVINYELILKDIDYLVDMGFDVIACDESHRIKNWASKTSKSIKKLNAPYKWAATGTPMQNRPEELFNLLSWVNPKILGSWPRFRDTHIIIGRKYNQDNMILGYKNLRLLHQKIAPYMLRRLKKDVAPELPDMIINNYYIEMYPEQMRLHNTINDELIELIKTVSKYTERDENGNIVKQHPKADQILGMLTMLQEVCNTPELLFMSESSMARRYTSSIKERGKSPKIDELLNILGEFVQSAPEGATPKAVIFTRFMRMQFLVIEALREAGFGGIEYVNGSMSSIDKQRRIDNFRNNNDINFIVATDSLNYGANIPEASLLINIDIPYNPAVLAQRNARIHRINSTHEVVNIINLIARDGVDERILDTLYNKQNMAESIVENDKDESNQLKYLTHNVMRKLLKRRKIKDDEQ